MTEPDELLEFVVEGQDRLTEYNDEKQAIIKMVRTRQEEVAENVDTSSPEGFVSFAREMEEVGIEALAQLMTATRYALTPAANEGNEMASKRIDHIAASIMELIDIIALYRTERIRHETEDS